MALPPMGLFQPHIGSQWPGCGQRSRGQGRPLPSAGRLPRPLPDKGCHRGPWGRQRPHHDLVSSSSEASAGQGAKSEHRKPPVTTADSPPLLGAPPWDGKSARERVGTGPCPPGPACAQGVRLCRSAAEGGGPVCLHFIAPKPGQIARHRPRSQEHCPGPSSPHPPGGRPGRKAQQDAGWVGTAVRFSSSSGEGSRTTFSLPVLPPNACPFRVCTTKTPPEPQLQPGASLVAACGDPWREQLLPEGSEGRAFGEEHVRGAFKSKSCLASRCDRP